MHRYRLFFSSYYFVVVAILAITTFLPPDVYSRWWFTAMWGLMAMMLVAGIIARRLWHNIPSFILHCSLIIILAGGFITSRFSNKGMMELHLGVASSDVYTADGESFRLPFNIELDSFIIDYYPGGIVPKDFTSHVRIKEQCYEISVNNIAKVSGYRFYQSSYDRNGCSIVSVNHDRWGTAVTYSGYILFALGGLLLLVGSKGRFRMLLKGTAIGLGLLSAESVSASPIAGLSLNQADSLTPRQVIYNGRIVTFNTLSRDFLKKIHGKTTYRGLTAEQVLGSWVLFPEEWNTQPIIQVKEKWLRDSLHSSGKYLSFTHLFYEDGEYRIAELYHTVQSSQIRALEELDEKAGLILTLLNGDLINPVPEDVKPLSDTRVRAELLYNSVPWTVIIFILLFTGATIGFTVVRITCRLTLVPWMLLWVSLVLQVMSYALEWFITYHIPLTNTFETLQFMVIITIVLSAIIGRWQPMLLYMGMLLAGAIALVAHLNYSNPILTPLMPVLASPWLSIHVTLVMTAYSLLAFTFLISLMSLCRLIDAEKARRMSLVILYPAIWILGLGIFTGAVWANVSWGRYWAWDPKETWALITMMVYAVPLHCNITYLKLSRNFNIYLLIAFTTVIMTYFGVNYLPSLHAYGG